jgi:hypothetical protein
VPAEPRLQIAIGDPNVLLAAKTVSDHVEPMRPWLRARQLAFAVNFDVDPMTRPRAAHLVPEAGRRGLGARRLLRRPPRAEALRDQRLGEPVRGRESASACVAPARAMDGLAPVAWAGWRRRLTNRLRHRPPAAQPHQHHARVQAVGDRRGRDTREDAAGRADPSPGGGPPPRCEAERLLGRPTGEKAPGRERTGHAECYGSGEDRIVDAAPYGDWP